MGNTLSFLRQTSHLLFENAFCRDILDADANLLSFAEDKTKETEDYKNHGAKTFLKHFFFFFFDWMRPDLISPDQEEQPG